MKNWEGTGIRMAQPPQMDFHAAPILPARRSLMRSGLKVGLGAAALSVLASGRAMAHDPTPPGDPEWSQSLGPGIGDSVYGSPSDFEKDVIRRDVPWLTASPESSISSTPLQYQEGIITPSGVFFERYHAGRPTVDPAQHRLMIHGLVNRPLMFTMADIKRFPSESRIHFIECPANGGMEWRAAQLNSLQYTHGMIGCAEWTGVKLSTLLQEVGIKPTAKWVLAEGADGAHMARSLPLDKCLDDVLVVYAQNGEALRPEQGYPLRLVVPGWQGSVNIKWIRRLEVGDQPWYTREETSKYTELMANGKARGFTWPIFAIRWSRPGWTTSARPTRSLRSWRESDAGPAHPVLAGAHGCPAGRCRGSARGRNARDRPEGVQRVLPQPLPRRAAGRFRERALRRQCGDAQAVGGDHAIPPV